MSEMTFSSKIEKLQGMWEIVLGHVATPTAADVGRWLVYDFSAVELAVLRTANRFARGRLHASFLPVEAYKYTTATARRIQEETKSERRAA